MKSLKFLKVYRIILIFPGLLMTLRVDVDILPVVNTALFNKIDVLKCEHDVQILNKT